MKALGMIEVYGYLAAVEALDSALKAANVSLTDVIRVKGGLVTVMVNGEVGAVKAAMDASAVAAGQVGKVISVHVIPRPSADVAMMLSGEDGEPGQIDIPCSREQLAQMTVAGLRKQAREIGITAMTRQEIRFAKKKELICAISEFMGQES